MDILIPVFRKREILHLYLPDEGINLGRIGGIEDFIFRKAVLAGRAQIGRKVKVTVAETLYGLVMLRGLRGEQKAGVFLGDDEFLLQIDFHGSFQQEEQIIPAAAGAVNRIIVLVKTVVFAEMKSDHGYPPDEYLWYKKRGISFPENSIEPEEKSNMSEKKNWRFLSSKIMMKIQR